MDESQSDVLRPYAAQFLSDYTTRYQHELLALPFFLPHISTSTSTYTSMIVSLVRRPSEHLRDCVVTCKYSQPALRYVHILYTHTGAPIHYTNTTSRGLHYPNFVVLPSKVRYIAVQILTVLLSKLCYNHSV